MIKITLLFFLIIVQINANEKELSALEIAQRMQDVDTSVTSQRKGLMLIEKKNKKLLRSFTLYGSKSKDINTEYSLITFTEPKDVRGTKYLSWTYKDINKYDDLWVYLPSVNLVRRISGSGGKMGSFMRSDFSNEDIEKRSINDDSYTLIGSEILFNQDTYLLELTPINKEGSAYSKKKIWVSKKTWQPIKIDFFDKSKRHFKTAIYGGMKKISGIWTVTKIKMETPRRKSKTLMQYNDIKYDIDLDDNFFSHSMLRNN